MVVLAFPGCVYNRWMSIERAECEDGSVITSPPHTAIVGVYTRRGRRPGVKSRRVGVEDRTGAR